LKILPDNTRDSVDHQEPAKNNIAPFKSEMMAQMGDSTSTLLNSSVEKCGLQILAECISGSYETSYANDSSCDLAVIETGECRQGISRYAPYGMRFAALMPDGTFKTSHLSGDLANRARTSGSKGSKVDLNLVSHSGEMKQLELSWQYFESFSDSCSLRPGPSEILSFLRSKNLDIDYRKIPHCNLLQRNASNFFKRMIDYGRKQKVQNCGSNLLSIDVDSLLKEMENPSVDVGIKRRRPKEASRRRNPSTKRARLHLFFAEAQRLLNVDDIETNSEHDGDWDVLDDENDDDIIVPSPRKLAKQRAPRLASSGIPNKGLSRHSPYGTRFYAEMADGTFQESYLAGDLAGRVRVGGKSRGELLLKMHEGEIEQLVKSWQFISERSFTPTSSSVLEFLQKNNIDDNYRKPGTKLLAKNAGNFFKRVQEFGKRREIDPQYLLSCPK
jgi:hypothetical protein